MGDRLSAACARTRQQCVNGCNVYAAVMCQSGSNITLRKFISAHRHRYRWPIPR
jgi:hypothetical protein